MNAVVLHFAWQTFDKPSTTISDTQAQRHLWNAVQHELLHPDVIAEYLDEWRLLEAEHRREAIKTRAAAERRLASLTAEENHIVDAIAQGMPISNLCDKAENLATERRELESQLAEHPKPREPMMHPTLIDHYRKSVEQLHQIADADDVLRPAKRAILVDLIEKIEAPPPPRRPQRHRPDSPRQPSYPLEHKNPHQQR